MIAIREPYWHSKKNYMYENALFQGCFTEVSFASYEENQLLYFQNGYFSKFFGDLLTYIIRKYAV
jgi:hypothetical protein